MRIYHLVKRGYEKGLVSRVPKLQPVPDESESVTLLPLCLIVGRGLSPKDQAGVPALSGGRLPVYVFDSHPLISWGTLDYQHLYCLCTWHIIQSLRVTSGWHARERQWTR